MKGIVFVILGMIMTITSIFVERVKPFVWLGVIFIVYGIFKMYLSKQAKKSPVVKKKKKKRKKK